LLKPATVPVANIKSIAVLPFKDFGGVTDEDRLGPGLADVLITRLRTLKGLNVRPTSAVLKFDGQDSIAAGRRLEVDAVLEGSIHRQDGRVRVTARLVAVNDRTTIWGAQFEHEPKDLFAIQDDLSRQVAQALISNLSDAQSRIIAKRPTESFEAFEHYMKGRYFWNKRTSADAEKAISHFEKAIAADPNYALAYSGLADCYVLRQVLPPAEALPKAKTAALKAVELDDTLADAHASLSMIKAVADFDRAGVEHELKRAIELNPNHALAHGWYAMHLTNIGRFTEGAEAAQRAQELGPTSPSLHMYAAWNFHHSRQFDRSIEEVRRALELDPNVRTCGLAARAYAMKGVHDEALAEGLRARAVQANGPSALGTLGYVYAVAGRPEEARVLLAELKERAGKSHVSPFYMALIHAGLGEKNRRLITSKKTIGNAMNG
jgi:TolB-like protein/Tfp pilus assembly protein PilF